MKKQLLLIRHAKSSWDDAGIDDFDRPLNERGNKDAPVMARRLLKKNISIDAFISSAARRAKKTCSLFMQEFNVDQKKMIVNQKLYLAPADEFYKSIADVDDAYETIAVFAHNSGITDFANSLTKVKIDNMPTCSIFAVSVKAKTWSQFKNAEKEFLFFDYPKNV
jgi:phosphohistidine phosphatase